MSRRSRRSGSTSCATPRPSARSTPTHAHNPHGRISYRRLDPGVYEVFLERLAATNDTAMIVTAYGSGAAACKPSIWFRSTDGTRPGTMARVRCFSPAGDPTDAMFSFAYAYPGLMVVVGDAG